MSPFGALRDQAAGAVLAPPDPGWETARRAWNLAVDQRPAAIVEAARVEDVQAAVRFAQAQELRVAPQSTGHGAESLGALDRAILLKTSRMRTVAVDAARGTVHAQAGALAGDIATAAGQHGLAAVLGLASTVGAVGLALSGGVGWLSRRHGFACHNVRAFEVVLSSGEVVRVDADSEPDLFWALRGGGGRTAIVTTVELQGHPVPELFGGAVMWPAEQAPDVLDRFVMLTEEAPPELSLVFRYLSVPDVEDAPPPLRGRRLVALIAANLGPEPAQFRAISEIPGAVVNMLGPVEPAQLVQIAGDPERPLPARGAGFPLDALPPAAAEVLSDMIVSDALPSFTVIEVRHLGGALAVSAPEHGAIGSLMSPFSVFASGAVITPDAAARIDADLERLRAGLDSWRSPRAMMSAAPIGTPPARGFDEDTWTRLQEIERAHDPGRLILSNREP